MSKRAHAYLGTFNYYMRALRQVGRSRGTWGMSLQIGIFARRGGTRRGVIGAEKYLTSTRFDIIVTDNSARFCDSTIIEMRTDTIRTLFNFLDTFAVGNYFLGNKCDEFV